VNDEAWISAAEEDSVDIVIMARTGTEGPIPIAGGLPVHLDETAGPPPELLADLLDSTIKLTAPADGAEELIDLIRATPVPRAFRATGWLTNHRALIFHDGRCEVGRFVLRYEPTLGLSIDDSNDLEPDQT
jgi:hypothetical protein